MSEFKLKFTPRLCIIIVRFSPGPQDFLLAMCTFYFLLVTKVWSSMISLGLSFPREVEKALEAVWWGCGEEGETGGAANRSRFQGHGV